MRFQLDRLRLAPETSRQMKTLPLRLALLSVVVLSALGAGATALAAETAGAVAPIAGAFAPAQSSGTDVMPMVIWSIVAISVFAVLFGTLYLLKRRIGGFPSNPAWVAPITIMPSKDFADEGSFPASAGDAAHH